MKMRMKIRWIPTIPMKGSEGMKRLVFIFSFLVLFISLTLTSVAHSLVKPTISQHLDFVQTDGNAIFIARRHDVFKLSRDKVVDHLQFPHGEVVLGLYIHDEYLIVITTTIMTHRNDVPEEDHIERPFIAPGYHQPDTMIYVYDKEYLDASIKTYRFSGRLKNSQRQDEKIVFVLNEWRHPNNVEHYDVGFQHSNFAAGVESYSFVFIVTLDLEHLTVNHLVYPGEAYQVHITPRYVYTLEHQYPIRVLNSEYTIRTHIRKFDYVDTLKLEHEAIVKGEAISPQQIHEVGDKLHLITSLYDTMGQQWYTYYRLDSKLMEMNRISLGDLSPIDAVSIMKDYSIIASDNRVLQVNFNKRKPTIKSQPIHGKVLRFVPMDEKSLFVIGNESTLSIHGGPIFITKVDINTLKQTLKQTVFQDDFYDKTPIVHDDQALFVDDSRKLIGIPITQFVSVEERDHIRLNRVHRYVLIKYDQESGFHQVLEITQDHPAIRRAFVVNNTFYTVSLKDVTAYSLDTFNLLHKVTFD